MTGANDSREQILGCIRSSLGRRPGQIPPDAPPPLFIPEELPREERLQKFFTALHALNARTCLATSLEDVSQYVEQIVHGKRIICSKTHLLRMCGITSSDCDPADAEAGITGAEYALAATGTLVMLASEEEPRLTSLLPPIHIAVVREDRLLSNIDELFAVISEPANSTSAMVLITGPSRTADIEQILVRGVHGPGELHVILLRN